MKPPVEIYNRNGWSLTSQGNGAFYTLRRGSRSAFFQGEAADIFRNDVIGHDGFLVDNCEERFSDYGDMMEDNQP